MKTRPTTRPSPAADFQCLERQCQAMGIDYHHMTTTEMRQAIADARAGIKPAAAEPLVTYQECQRELREWNAANGIPAHEPLPGCHGAGPCLRRGTITAGDGSTWCASCWEAEHYPGGRFYVAYTEGESI